MTSKNDITGDEIKSKQTSDSYRDGWDRIFGKKESKNEKSLSDYIARVALSDKDEDSKTIA